MKLMRWSFRSLSLPMLETDDGVLYCTSRVLCTALGLTDTQLRKVLSRHGDRLSPTSVTKRDANNFLRENKEEFGLQRVRNDVRLWSLKEALGVAFHVHTNLAWEFHQSAIDLIIEQATKNTVTQAEHMELEARLQANEAKLDNLSAIVRRVAGPVVLTPADRRLRTVKPLIQ